jgi:hypothetical protein
MLAKHALSQLSYGPSNPRKIQSISSFKAKQPQAPAIKAPQAKASIETLPDLVGPERFELSTSRLSSARSNQLSYGPAPGQQAPATRPRRKRNEDGGSRISLSGNFNKAS